MTLALWHLGGTTSVSSGTAAGVAGMTNSRQRILDFYDISKLLAVDTEVDPPQQNSPTPTESRITQCPWHRHSCLLFLAMG